MRPISWFLLLLAGLLVVAACCSASKFTIDDYVELPEPKDFQAEYHRDVREVLLSINVTEESNLHSILASIKLLRESSHSGSRSTILATLEKLADSVQDCDDEFVKLAKSILAQTRADAELEKKSAILVAKLLKKKFILCFAIHKYNVELSHSGLRLLDELFIKALEVDKKLDKRQEQILTKSGQIRVLTKKIQEFDMANDKFSAKRMVRLAKIHADVKSFEEVMDWSCQSLGKYANSFDMINIATALAGGGLQIWQREMIRRNEYRRICLAWKRKRDAIMINSMKQKSNGCMSGLA
jgi:hypothetical protein